MTAARLSRFRTCLPTVVLGSLSLGACTAAAPLPYHERHEIRRLTVVFMDQRSLQSTYTSISGKPAVSISGYPPLQSLTTVRGFYDFATNTLYCSKLDFTVCGHELHHAVLGRFHDE